MYLLSLADLVAAIRKFKNIGGRETSVGVSLFLTARIFIVNGTDKLSVVVDYEARNRITKRKNVVFIQRTRRLNILNVPMYSHFLSYKPNFIRLNLKKNDLEKEALITKYGQFEDLAMSKSACNSSATIQFLMNDMFQDSIYEYSYVYTDDLLISKNEEVLHVCHT